MNLERAEKAKLIALAALRQEYITCLGMEIVGSAYISDREDSDIDVLCHVKCVDDTDAIAFGASWKYGGSGDSHMNDKFGSWKKHFPEVGVLNLLVTKDKAYYDAWLTSAEVCRFLHLRGMALPAALVHGVHEIIMDDSDAETEAERRNY